jgi:lactam utilization protein B
MPWRYVLFVTPIETHWRVSVLDDVAQAPERICDHADRQGALQFAHQLADELAELGDQVTVTETR